MNNEFTVIAIFKKRNQQLRFFLSKNKTIYFDSNYGANFSFTGLYNIRQAWIKEPSENDIIKIYD